MDYKALLEKYEEEIRTDIIPATEQQIKIFVSNCKKHNIPQIIEEELVQYYKVCKSIFG